MMKYTGWYSGSKGLLNEQYLISKKKNYFYKKKGKQLSISVIVKSEKVHEADDLHPIECRLGVNKSNAPLL